MEEDYVPRIIRLQESLASRRVIGPPPTWEGCQKRTLPFGVYVMPWPWWKRVLFSITGASWCEPQRLSQNRTFEPTG